MQIELRPTAVLLLCGLYYLSPLIFIAFVLAAAAHELGHLFAVWLLGGRIARFTIGAGGACIQASLSTYGRQLVCTLAGPAANLVLLLLTARTHPEFALLNMILAVYNLLPIPQLDGGEALACFLLLLVSPERQRVISQAAAYIALAACFALACWCCFGLHGGIWPLLAVLVLTIRIPKENSVAFRRFVP